MLGFDRITFDSHVMGGSACIRGMRITVALLVHLVANGKRGAFYSLRREIHQEHSPLSATLLNAYVHNEFTKPSPRELRNAWDHAQPFFEKVWEILGE